VHVYAGFSSGYVVEGNRLNGDSALFRSLYSTLKMDLAPEDVVPGVGGGVSYDSFTVFTPLPAPFAFLPASTDLHGLGPIFRMAQSPYQEAKLEAARTLCEYSAEEGMRLQLVQLGCIPVLMDLLQCANSSLQNVLTHSAAAEWLQQHALMALANLSDGCCKCKKSIIESGIAASLLNLCCDGTYQTAEIRMLGAYILANITGHCGATVASTIGSQALTSWFATVDKLTDERVRLHSSRARDNLIVCI